MTYTWSKPNRKTVWSMFVLGIMVGVGSAYVAIDPDGIIDLMAKQMIYSFPMCVYEQWDEVESVENITEHAQDLFKTSS